MISIYVTALALLLIAGIFAAFFFALFRHSSGTNPPGPRWLDEFSLDKYRPLERFFDSADLEFVAAQPGYTASLGRKLASSRRAAARLYLAELTVDFDRLVRTGREMLAGSREDRPDLASTLFQQWLAFHLRVLSLRLRLRLAPLGLAPRRPAGLLEALGRMRSVVAVLDVPVQA
ncbi:MAG: hypothetical protein ABSH47_13445 [Bryobacteraceae bacterium]|jgi:hypothetical protein